MTLLIKVSSLVMLPFIVAGMIATPFNGMIITSKGTVLFIPDIRLIKRDISDIERIAITFNEWENCKYSATVRFVCKDGRIFEKNYSSEFRNRKQQKSAMSLYTIKKSKVDEICKSLSDVDICVITIVDKNRSITYQKT